MKQLTDSEIVKIYSEAMSFSNFHRLIFAVACFAVGFWFMSPAIFGNEPPKWVFYVAFSPVILWVLLALPKHFRVIFIDNRLTRIYRNPLLGTRCALAAIKPPRTETSSQTWTLLYYLSLAAPIVGLAITFFLLAT